MFPKSKLQRRYRSKFNETLMQKLDEVDVHVCFYILDKKGNINTTGRKLACL